MARANRWTINESNELIKLWGQNDVEKISELMGRHRLTILQKARELGLRKARSKKWSEGELSFLKENYDSKHSCSRIATKLKRTERSVYTMAERLGLKVTWDYRRIDKDGYIEIILGSSKKTKEHRMVYEKETGIKQKPSDHIHHLDEDKKNNKIENLILLNPSNHNRLHFLINKNDLKGLREFTEVLQEHDKRKYLKWLESLSNVI
ncbi:HNH endonuclease [Bacillus nakamurai]|uniref:HNH nuclease domain-containing protein n=1 Tax=Bacillus nakamurai TaxID=1793963 RepID=A0A150FB92_9BACI|nr:HNH endonuclease [Bacillus nakamurai]KXZ22404.1 hypothetical protein AXI58_10465 [Bacillus nakamurai]MED1228371.1 HNH endonuclease [Bacillus nakamurai]